MIIIFTSLVLLAIVYFTVLHIQKLSSQRQSRQYIQQHPDQFTHLSFLNSGFSIEGDTFEFPYNQPLSEKTDQFNFQPHGTESIEHIFVVNRQCDTEQLSKIKMQLQQTCRFELTQANILDAVDASRFANSFHDLKQHKILHPGFNRTFPMVPMPAQLWRRKGIFGHYLSLYKALLLAHKNNLKNFLWIEDDCIFTENAFNSIEKFIENTSAPWDVINLGLAPQCYRRNHKLFNQSPTNLPCDSQLYSLSDLKGLMFQTHAVLFNQSAYEKMIRQFFPMLAPSDITIGNWCSSQSINVACPFPQKTKALLNGYFCYPPLASQLNEKRASLTAKSAFWC